ncbi:phage tail fiber protein [Nocardia sp. NPDC003963]
MALNVLTTANTIAQAWADLGASYSLHTGNPGTAGTANEATGGGYSRQTTTWGSPSNGKITGSQLTFNVVAGSYTHMCRWSGTTLRDIIDTVDASVSPDGQIKVTPSSGDALYTAWT